MGMTSIAFASLSLCPKVNNLQKQNIYLHKICSQNKTITCIKSVVNLDQSKNFRVWNAPIQCMIHLSVVQTNCSDDEDNMK